MLDASNDVEDVFLQHQASQKRLWKQIHIYAAALGCVLRGRLRLNQLLVNRFCLGLGIGVIVTMQQPLQSVFTFSMFSFRKISDIYRHVTALAKRVNTKLIAPRSVPLMREHYCTLHLSAERPLCSKNRGQQVYGVMQQYRMPFCIRYAHPCHAAAAVH